MLQQEAQHLLGALPSVPRPRPARFAACQVWQPGAPPPAGRSRPCCPPASGNARGGSRRGFHLRVADSLLQLQLRDTWGPAPQQQKQLVLPTQQPQHNITTPPTSCVSSSSEAPRGEAPPTSSSKWLAVEAPAPASCEIRQGRSAGRCRLQPAAAWWLAVEAPSPASCGTQGRSAQRELLWAASSIRWPCGQRGV